MVLRKEGFRRSLSKQAMLCKEWGTQALEGRIPHAEDAAPAWWKQGQEALYVLGRRKAQRRLTALFGGPPFSMVRRKKEPFEHLSKKQDGKAQPRLPIWYALLHGRTSHMGMLLWHRSCKKERTAVSRILCILQSASYVRWTGHIYDSKGPSWDKNCHDQFYLCFFC